MQHRRPAQQDKDESSSTARVVLSDDVSSSCDNLRKDDQEQPSTHSRTSIPQRGLPAAVEPPRPPQRVQQPALLRGSKVEPLTLRGSKVMDDTSTTFPNNSSSSSSPQRDITRKVRRTNTRNQRTSTASSERRNNNNNNDRAIVHKVRGKRMVNRQLQQLLGDVEAGGVPSEDDSSIMTSLQQQQQADKHSSYRAPTFFRYASSGSSSQSSSLQQQPQDTTIERFNPDNNNVDIVIPVATLVHAKSARIVQVQDNDDDDDKKKRVWYQQWGFWVLFLGAAAAIVGLVVGLSAGDGKTEPLRPPRSHGSSHKSANTFIDEPSPHKSAQNGYSYTGFGFGCRFPRHFRGFCRFLRYSLGLVGNYNQHDDLGTGSIATIHPGVVLFSNHKE